VAAAQQVSWWDTHVFISKLTADLNLPPAGTPEWCAVPDGDPRKLLALAVAGEHHVLRVETAQQARADASKAVAGAADWSKVSREIQHRSAFREAQPWAKRVAS